MSGLIKTAITAAAINMPPAMLSIDNLGLAREDVGNVLLR